MTDGILTVGVEVDTPAFLKAIRGSIYTIIITLGAIVMFWDEMRHNGSIGIGVSMVLFAAAISIGLSGCLWWNYYNE